ncbi:carbohydrate ABC transporter permease [Virgisporangium aurantiacum]|uniref:Sugar ABC transporter permease n=1 Tax=Virgisporangium aurantiacum TaxID=175570 RepID=A0A8J4E3U6_9ACTN|nr:sugar ABC transporter permease [Virgisporangium aurantiacum]GIJ60491.1 sugar ABC transporter permease [Virgisporangium aurantiacum]
MRRGKYPFIIGFLIVPVTLYVTYVVAPYIQAFQLAMTNWRGVSANAKFVGLENFERLLKDDTFWAAVRHHGIILLVMPLVTIIIALFFAFMLNVGGGSRGGELRGIWGSKFYRLVFFFPQLLAVVIVGVIFNRVYAPDDSGLLNGMLGSVGIDPVLFMADKNIALWAMIAVLVWQAIGFYVVLFSAGMASVPREIVEAAMIDGASRFSLFFRVTLPLLWDTLQVAWVYLGIAAFDAFAIVQVLSVDEGGPDNATTVLGMEIYKSAFREYQMGYASAMGVALFFLTLTFAALTLRVTRRETIEM